MDTVLGVSVGVWMCECWWFRAWGARLGLGVGGWFGLVGFGGCGVLALRFGVLEVPVFCFCGSGET